MPLNIVGHGSFLFTAMQRAGQWASQELMPVTWLGQLHHRTPLVMTPLHVLDAVDLYKSPCVKGTVAEANETCCAGAVFLAWGCHASPQALEPQQTNSPSCAPTELQTSKSPCARPVEDTTTSCPGEGHGHPLVVYLSYLQLGSNTNSLLLWISCM